MTTETACEHPEWIGEPYGFVPTHWRCTTCSTVVTAGELIILNAVKSLTDEKLKTKPHR